MRTRDHRPPKKHGLIPLIDTPSKFKLPQFIGVPDSEKHRRNSAGKSIMETLDDAPLLFGINLLCKPKELQHAAARRPGCSASLRSNSKNADHERRGHAYPLERSPAHQNGNRKMAGRDSRCKTGGRRARI